MKKCSMGYYGKRPSASQPNSQVQSRDTCNVADIVWLLIWLAHEAAVILLQATVRPGLNAETVAPSSHQDSIEADLYHLGGKGWGAGEEEPHRKNANRATWGPRETIEHL